MADISGLILTCLGLSFEVASAIYNYARDVKDAKQDIQNFSNELFALIGVLERLKMQQERQEQLSFGRLEYSSKAFARKENQPIFRQVLQQSIEFLQELHKSLVAPKNRFQSRVQKLKWPFKEGETKRHLKRLERVKSYLILSLMTDEIELTQQIASEISNLSLLARQSSQEQRKEDTRVIRQKLLTWLSPVDPRSTREKVAKIRTNRSGAWFLSSDVFQGWVGSKASSTLWLTGITGAGKTTLMQGKLLTLGIERAEGCTAYFYCSFTDNESLDVRNILGSILAQLCGSTDTFEKIKSRYDQESAKSFGNPRNMDTDQTVNLIVERIRDLSHAFLFLDGVNECGNPDEILTPLKTISNLCDNVHMFISSINEKGIADCLQQMPRLTIETLHSWDIADDINMLVQANLETHPRLRYHTPQLKKEITLALTHGAQGMFRWVYCQLDLLSRLRTPGAVRNALKSLPPTLDKTYEALLSRIDGEEDKKLTREILELLAFSLRPLTLLGICDYLQITPGMLVLDESKRLTDPKDVLNICGSLLNLSGQFGHVTLAHHSVKSYLISDIKGDASYFRLSALDAHRNLAIKCLAYLSLEEFSSGPCETESGIMDRYQRYPFLGYASLRWAPHTQRLEELGESLWGILKHFLFSGEAGRGNFSSWVQLLIPGSKRVTSTPPLYYAASFGLTTVVRYLLEAGVDVEIHGGRGSATPINIASFRGHEDVVKLLLRYGADPHAQDVAGLSAIQWAHSNQHWKVVEIFEGMEGNSKSDADGNWLSYPKRDKLSNTSCFKDMEVVKVQLKPAWGKSEKKRRLWWRLVGLAARGIDHPVSVAIHGAARFKLVGSQGFNIGGITSDPEVSTNGAERYGVSRLIEPGGLKPWDLVRSEKYGVLVGTLSFLSSHGVNVHDDMDDDLIPVGDDRDFIEPSQVTARILIAIDGVYAGAISLCEIFPPEAGSELTANEFLNMSGPSYNTSGGSTSKDDY
ncbi:hypothetical protein MMC22_003808 [Lobaria immixta]|nr:hypothetical protein [Lobaria immixta]